jgi:hypothetical protein
VLAIVIGFSLIRIYGVWGAAAAVPAYYGLQLAASAYFAVRSGRSGGYAANKDQPDLKA